MPVEGETFDEEVLASTGLSLVDAPSSSSGEPEEEELLRKLLSLYRAWQAKLASREARTPAASAEPGSEEPQPGAYLQAGDNIFIKLPWASSSRVPVEGETFDEEVLASTGLSLVDAPSSSSGEPEEEELLRKLLSLYRAWQAKLASREALVFPGSACREGGS